MADEPEELLLDDPIEPVEGEEQQEAETNDDELEIEIEGEQPDDATPLVKTLREQIRDRDKELAEYRRQTAPKPIEVGEEPEMADFDYDEPKFKAAYDAWKDRTREAAEQAKAQEQKGEVANREAQRNLANYQMKKAGLPAEKMQASEDTVLGALSMFAQSAILQYADDPARVVYALGQHPAKLAQMMEIEASDPGRFIKELTLLERNLKVTTRRAAPPPEGDTILRGSAPTSTPKKDEMEDKLLEKAMKPGGTMTEYNRYMKAKKAAAK